MKMKLIILLLSISLIDSVSANVSFDFAGRFEFDYSVYDDDYTFYPGNEFDTRRFRFGLFTKFNDNFSTYFQTDFSNSLTTHKASTQAAWIRYRFNKDNELYTGKMEMPFSLESVSNSKYHYFMERSISSALTERFGTGFNYTHYGKDWNLRVGAFGDDHFSLGSSNSYGKSITSRIGKKLKAFDGNFYLGGSFQHRKPDESIKIRTLPESYTVRTRLIDTDEIAFVKSIKKVGVEALFIKDVWSIQTEYIKHQIEREFGSDLNYNGGYLILSKMFNGRRRFNYRKGEWKSAKIKNFKTWELSARYSFLDLQATELKSGYQKNLSLGVNYYISKLNRIMFNYIRAEASPNSSAVSETLNIYQVRFQFEF